MGTLFVGAVLVAVIAAAVYKLRKDKKAVSYTHLRAHET